MANVDSLKKLWPDATTAGVQRWPRNCGIVPGRMDSAPTASEDYQGAILFVPGAAGAHDRHYLVQKNAADAYQLKDFGNELLVAVSGTNVALANSGSAQAVFLAADDTLIVPSDITYAFDMLLMLNTGGTSHTTSVGFGGTATFTSLHYVSSATSSAADTLGTPQRRRVSSAAAAAVTAASTAVNTDIMINGIMRINAGGTIIPQITFSVDPTGTCETVIDSYLRLIPYGTKTLAERGGWA